MSLRKLTAGDGYDYLTRQVAAHDSTEKGHTALGDYYDEHGESPGRWVGHGLAGLGMAEGEYVDAAQMKSLFGTGRHPNAEAFERAALTRGAGPSEVAAVGALGTPFKVYSAASTFRVRVAEELSAYNRDRGLHWKTAVPAEVRSQIRTTIGRGMFWAEHGRDPLDERELSGFVAKASRQATTAVAGFDLTFSPVKSVSTLWAIAPRDVADQVRAAHEAAVADTLAFLEREVGYTRVGKGGARQVPVTGLVAASFVHRDSRAGDPDLHTHLAVSNKVQTEDGRWLALDARLLYAAKVTASEHYNTRLEAELIDRLGIEFAERDEPTDKRPVREIRGISTALTRWWSHRRIAIQARQSELAADFQARHGRPPLATEAIALGQQATLETRGAKHEPRSETDQRHAWMAEACDVMGSAAGVDNMIQRAVHRHTQVRTPTREWVEEASIRALSAIEQRRATWQVWHVHAEAERQVRGGEFALDLVDETVAAVVAATLSRSVALTVPDLVKDPPALTRTGGESMYDVHGATVYTSARVLAAEHELLDAAHTDGYHQLTQVRVEIALEESKADGVELNDAQAAMVKSLATSGEALQLALAPAGTGKTTAMSVLSRAWTEGGGTVIGLAPSAQAAHELGQALTGRTDTLAKLTWTLAHEAPEAWPRWITDIGPGHLIVIDEAGQASTTELATAIRFVNDRGGIVRLVGDDQQLAAVGAGGVLRDIQHEVGASTLSEIRRFDDAAEAAATLAVREGDTGAIGFYLDHGRIHVGNLATAADQAYAAWAADRATGLDAVLLAPTREQVNQLNARARADRLRPDPSGCHESQPEVQLCDGNHASAGDTIITRRNERRLMIARSNWVKNGDRWRIEAVLPGGRLHVRHLDLDRLIELPADYVSRHVQLGYATTVHGAQGMTTDSSHVVVTGEESRQLLYVALSRGRQANHAYLVTSTDGDAHSVIEQEALIPPTAVDVLTQILRRDGSDRSATTALRDAESPATQLHEAVLRYHDALGVAAEDVLGPERLAAIDHEAGLLWPGLPTDPAYPTLRSQLALLALDGSDPIATLMDAAASREIGTSQDRAAVLSWRLDTATPTGGGPLPWLDAIPVDLADHPAWGPYLAARADRVRHLAAVVRDDAHNWTPRSTPAWAEGIRAGEHDGLRGDVAVWRAAFDVPADDDRIAGRPQQGAAVACQQRDLERRTTGARGRRRADETILDQLPDEVRADPGLDRLSSRLAALDAAHVDVSHLIATATSSGRPLPDECAADALWWRIAGHLGPAALRASEQTSADLRPPWAAHLTERLGADVAARIMEDAMWPALVAAVRARPAEWTAEQLIDSATSGPRDGTRPEALCSALVWRIATMTDPQPFTEPEPPEYDFTGDTRADLGYDQAAAALTEHPPDGVSVDRIVELNQMALAYFEEAYPRSWAPTYLRDRLGADLIYNKRFSAGYAPPGPASLVRHLEDRGATVGELVAAGLAKVNDAGRVVDAFRDRIVFPLHSGTRLVGFVGRRNPTKTDGDYAGPKYLNTRTTAAFVKGEQLFGLSEAADALNAGAIPVLVEGPMDALAVSLAGGEDAVGIAPLGTALTEQQAATLKNLWRGDAQRLVIATDPDHAGWLSAQRTFWRLAMLGGDPRHLPLPDGADPADFVRTAGAVELVARLAQTRSLGRAVIDRTLTERLGDDADSIVRTRLAEELAAVVSAQTPDQWLEQANYLAQRLDIPVALVSHEIFEAWIKWTGDPTGCVERQLASLRPAPPRTSTRIPDGIRDTTAQPRPAAMTPCRTPVRNRSVPR